VRVASQRSGSGTTVLLVDDTHRCDALTKVALRDGGPRDWAVATQWEGLAQAVTLASDDLAEGLAALHEKRTPRFTGR